MKESTKILAGVAVGASMVLGINSINTNTVPVVPQSQIIDLSTQTTPPFESVIIRLPSEEVIPQKSSIIRIEN